MQANEFVKNALKTESRDFATIGQRMIAVPRDLASLLSVGVVVSQTQDALKKHCFYGKPIKDPGVPEPETFLSQEQIHANLSKEENIRLIHGAIGAFTEAGELQEQLYKHLFLGKDLDKVNLAEEVGDTLWYLAILCDTLGVQMEDVMEKIIAKLRARYADKFTEESAINRDVAAERKILES